jgi:hypothetical protein
MVVGFTIYVSSHVCRVFDAGVAAWAYHLVGGLKDATAFATVLEHTRIIENDKDNWDKYYQGLQVYGFGVLQPSHLIHGYVRL